MAKKKPDADAESDKDSLRLDAEMVRKARVVAAAKGMSAPQYINETMLAAIEHDLPEVMRLLGVANEGRT